MSASRTSSFISLYKTIIGAGLLSIPLAFSTDGFAGAVFLVCTAGITAAYGLYLQVFSARFVPVGHATFFSVCQITYPSLSVAFDVAIAIQCFGCAISYLVLIGELMPTIVTHVPGVDPSNYRLFWIAASTVVCVPLSFLKNLDSLRHSSVLALGAITYLIFVVVGEYYFGHVPAELKGSTHLWPKSFTSVCSTFSIIVFAFTGHQNMYSIVNEASDKSTSALVSLITLTTLGTTAAFLIVGFYGYMTFGDLVGGNVVLSYPSSFVTQLSRFAIVFIVVCSFPLMIHPARISVNNIHFWVKKNFFTPSEDSTALLGEDVADEEASVIEVEIVPLTHRTFCVITVSLLVVGYALAISIKSFAFILSIVGATGSTAISFILPGLFGYKLTSPENASEIKISGWHRHAAAALVVWGFFVMVVCLYSTLKL